MEFKKLLILGLVLLAVGMALTAVSADDSVSTTSGTMTLENNKLTINGICFLVPDGFQEVEKDSDSTGVDNDDGAVDKEDIDGTTVDSKMTSEFKNTAGDELEVTVGTLANDKKIESINPAGFEQKTIAGKEGYVLNITDDGKTQIKFEYLEDGKLVKIVAPSEDMISQIIA